ncbi:MAG: hypothetical protein Q9196_003633, partial [Gyalolechia fulgens]
MSTPTSVHTDTDPADIASAMGFASFGAQPQPKKRKVAHPPPASASGGNRIPLAKGRRARGTATPSGDGTALVEDGSGMAGEGK